LLGLTARRQHRAGEFLDLAAADADIVQQPIIEPSELANDRPSLPFPPPTPLR